MATVKNTFPYPTIRLQRPLKSAMDPSLQFGFSGAAIKLAASLLSLLLL